MDTKSTIESELIVACKHARRVIAGLLKSPRGQQSRTDAHIADTVIRDTLAKATAPPAIGATR